MCSLMRDVARMFTTCRKTKTKLLKSGLKLIGGKTKTRDIFYALRPDNITTYLEPFLGSGNVLTGLPRFEREIVGDVNVRVINFFRVMQTRPDDLFNAIEREVFFMRQFNEAYYYLLRKNEPIDRVANAAWFYVITKYGMNGIFRTDAKGICNTPFCKTVDGRGIFTREWFDAVCERIKGVEIHRQNYHQTLFEVDDPNAWAFIDPPYRACKTTYNGIKFTDREQLILRNTLRVLPYRWLLTINDDEVTRELYQGFNIIPHEISYSCSQTPAGRGKRPELIVTNYDC